MNDDVQEAVNGFVYSFGNIDQLAEKIAELESNPEVRRKMGKASHEISVRFQRIAHGDFVKNLMDQLR
jgi:glycosyltransferase involved in cell wall biosynthesis